MEFFVVMIIVLVIAGLVIPIAIGQAKRANQAWARAAGKLQLSFRPGGFMQSRQIEGSVNGFKVVVDTYTTRRGNHNQTYTRFRVRYPSLGLGLKLQNAGFFSGVTKLFGAQDIEVGASHFDRELVVKGRHPGSVKKFLTSSRRMRIHRFLLKHRGASIDDREIRWSSSGVIRDANQLVRVIRALASLAAHLSREPEEGDATLQNALDQQNRGRADEALKLLTENRQPGPPEDLEVGTEERLVEGELLYLADRAEEAQEVFAEAHARDPDDVEIEQWYQGLRGELDSDAEAAVVDANEPVRSGDELDAASISRSLFESGATSFRITRQFEEKYLGKLVHWSGQLERVEPYSYDLVFGDGPGCRAVLTIHQLGSSVYGDQVVSAVVQFPEESVEELRGRTGEELSFSGKLAKVDGLMRKIYVQLEVSS